MAIRDKLGRSTPNHLANEKSPYLLEHAFEAVDWYPWGEEAFEKARAEDKPIFLSIGYSSCHWCHVMREESFEDAGVAQMMNDAFVSVKVDREERPDVDVVYMSVCQMITGSGGWPLTIIMTPDRRPFFAATFIPKEAAFGKMGMLQLVPRVKEMWATERSELLEYGDQVVKAFRSSAATAALKDPDQGSLKLAFGELNERFDRENGGFGDAPKFPSPHNLLFLLRYWKRTGDAEALAMVEKTLSSMRLGGIWDQLGGGFHRYSTDRSWTVPHFEKMLYDQAMMIMAYGEAFQATKKGEYAHAVDEIVRYLVSRMKSEAGGFCSSEDADSEGLEGKFYTWTQEELGSCLGKEAEMFTRVFGLGGTEGRLQEGQAMEARQVLRMRLTPAEWASKLGVPVDEFVPRLEQARAKLLARRQLRAPPRRDDKLLTDWNGLLVAALAKASRALGQPEYAKEAKEVADFLLWSMREADGRLLHTRRGALAVKATLDDYAFVLWGFWELYEATMEVGLLRSALSLAEDMIAHFSDRSGGGFFFTADDAEEIFCRQKVFDDGAIPSGNSVAAYVLFRLGRISSKPELEKAALMASKAAWNELIKAPSRQTMLLCALDYYFGPSVEVVIAGGRGKGDTMKMEKAVDGIYLPNAVLVLNDPSDGSLSELMPFATAMNPMDGKATAYVCQDLSCQLPTTRLSRMLSSLGVPARPSSKEG